MFIRHSAKRLKMASHLDLDIANAVAVAMKDWAVENGATHFTHWFQPMTGITAEKHDSFHLPHRRTAKLSWSFPAKSWLRANRTHPASPPADLRATFEARGYTAWDPTSYAFIKDDTLCISQLRSAPTAARRSIKKPRSCVLWKPSTNEAVCVLLNLFGNTDVTRVIYHGRPGTGIFPGIDKELLRSKRRSHVLPAVPCSVPSRRRVRNWKIITSALSSPESPLS